MSKWKALEKKRKGWLSLSPRAKCLRIFDVPKKEDLEFEAEILEGDF